MLEICRLLTISTLERCTVRRIVGGPGLDWGQSRELLEAPERRKRGVNTLC